MTTITIAPTIPTLAQQLAQEAQDLLAKLTETPPTSEPNSADIVLWGG